MISAINYDFLTGTFSFTGNNLLESGDSSGLKLANFTLTGANGGTYTFDPSSDILENLSNTGFNVTLSSFDEFNLNALLNKNGNTATDGTLYNFTASNAWDNSLGQAINTLAVSVNSAPTSYQLPTSYQATAYIATDSIGNSYIIAKNTAYTQANEAIFRYNANAQLVIGTTLNTANIGGVAVDKSGNIFLVDNTAHQIEEIIQGSNDITSLYATGNNTISGLTIDNNGNLYFNNGNLTEELPKSAISVPTVVTAANYDALTGTITVQGSGFNTNTSAYDLSHFVVQFDASNITTTATYSFTNPVIKNLSSNALTIQLSLADQQYLDYYLTSNGIAALNLAQGWLSTANAIIVEDFAQLHPPLAVIPAKLNGNLGLTNPPTTLAVDNAANVYTVDSANNNLDEINYANSTVNTLLSKINITSNLTIDGNANLYFALGNSIEKLGSASHTPTLINSSQSSPTEFSADKAGNLFFITANNNLVEIKANANIANVLSSGLTNPVSLIVDQSDNLYFISGTSVEEYHANTKTISTLVSTGLYNPTALAIDSNNNLYIADSGNTANGNLGYLDELTGGSQAILNTIFNFNVLYTSLIVDNSDNLYFTAQTKTKIAELYHYSYTPNLSAVLNISAFEDNTAELHLSKSIFTAFSNGTLTAANISNSGTATSNSQYLIYHPSTGELDYAVHGSTTTTPLEIAVIGINNHPAALVTGDFALI